MTNPEVEKLARSLYRAWWGPSWCKRQGLDYEFTTPAGQERWRRVAHLVIHRDARIRKAAYAAGEKRLPI